MTMSRDDQAQIDDLLDDWEERQRQCPEPSLDDFVANRCTGLSADVVARFQSSARKLLLMDRRLEAVGEVPRSGAHGGDHRRQGGLKLSNLVPGCEPIAGYTLVAPLGDGGFGKVWKAAGPGGFHVALKFVPIGGRVGEIEERSLELIRDVRHPNLLSVFGTWRVDDMLVIATELADRTLMDRFEEAQKEGHEGIPPDELLRYMEEAAKGIDYLNGPVTPGRLGIQHGDIKPQNMLLSGGSVKVGDFGLARSLRFDVTGHSGSLTFAYAAPECFDGKTSNRSDQYSLAVTYCYLRSGWLPFDGTPVEIMEGHRKKPPNLSRLAEAERPVVAKALSKLPKDRWASCMEFVRAVNDSSRHSAGAQTSTGGSPGTLTGKMLSLKRFRAFGTCVGLVLALVVVLALILRSKPNVTPPPQGTTDGQTPEGTAQIPMSSPVATRPRLAVLYFENDSPERTKLMPLEKSLCSMMIAYLHPLNRYRIVERERLEEVLRELKRQRDVSFDPKTAANIGRLVGAQYLVLGSYFELFDQFRIDARIVEVETGITVAACGVDGKPENFGTLIHKLVVELARRHSSAQNPNSTAAAAQSIETRGTNVATPPRFERRKAAQSGSRRNRHEGH